jgi:preprotein translocase subunit SecE
LGVRFPPGLPTFRRCRRNVVTRSREAAKADYSDEPTAKPDVGTWDEKATEIKVRANVADEPGRFDTVKEAAGGRIERSRLFLSEVRNELKRVTWPSQKEVYATTVVVIATSVFFGIYLFALDQILLTSVQWIFRRFGAA